MSLIKLALARNGPLLSGPLDRRDVVQNTLCRARKWGESTQRRWQNGNRLTNTASVRVADNLWRGSLLPLGCEAAPKQALVFLQVDTIAGFRAASKPNGNKFLRHRMGAC